jgi:hypothetical protein
MLRSTNILLLCAISLIISSAYCQQPKANKIQLTPPPIQLTAHVAVWRTDYYICTGIAYARSLGKTVDDFAVFVGDHHTWEELRGKGLEPVVKVLNLLIRNYQNGTFEIVSESDTCVTMRSNRPYATSFKDGPLLGVTVDDFEHFLWGHMTILADRIGLGFKYEIQGGYVTSTLSLRK